MVVSRCARVYPSFECRSDADFSSFSRQDNHKSGDGFHQNFTACLRRVPSGLSSLILRFAPNFVRQLSVKSWRNYNNIDIAQIVAAAWSDNKPSGFTPAVKAVESAAAAIASVEKSTDANQPTQIMPQAFPV